MKGTPQNMMKMAHYEDLIGEIMAYFAQKSDRLRKMGVNDIIIDPGFGFGKNIEHNFLLLKNLDLFKVFNLPVMVGLSRKSMIYKTLGLSPEHALNGTTVLNTLALKKGANILRVHDVKQAREAILLVGKCD
jgi:dihydropteroate synthase